MAGPKGKGGRGQEGERVPSTSSSHGLCQKSSSPHLLTLLMRSERGSHCFPGTLAGNWIRSRASRSRPSIHRGCPYYRQRLSLSHGTNSSALIFIQTPQAHCWVLCICPARRLFQAKRGQRLTQPERCTLLVWVLLGVSAVGVVLAGVGIPIHHLPRGQGTWQETLGRCPTSATHTYLPLCTKVCTHTHPCTQFYDVEWLDLAQ